jgi:DNA-binding XRE family transcriptional regulator
MDCGKCSDNTCVRMAHDGSNQHSCVMSGNPTNRALTINRDKLSVLLSVMVSQKECAEVVGVHRTYITSIELGKVNVRIEVANQLAQALGLRLSDLVRAAEHAVVAFYNRRQR